MHNYGKAINKKIKLVTRPKPHFFILLRSFRFIYPSNHKYVYIRFNKNI